MQIVLKKIKKIHQKNSKLILKTHKIFRSEKHHAFTDEINKIALNSNDDCNQLIRLKHIHME